MESRYPLKSLYESYFNQDNGNGANLTAFFETDPFSTKCQHGGLLGGAEDSEVYKMHGL